MNDVIEQTPRIETRRLVLRAPTSNDAGRIARLANDFDVARMTARLPHPYDRHHAETFLAGAAALDPARAVAFAIELEDEGLIGIMGFHSTGGVGPEIGYWLGHSYWGRGLATEAVLGGLAWAKTAWRRRAAVAGCFIDNPASSRVLEKAGFLHTGEIRTLHCEARGEALAARMMVWLA
jgi:RimJ/RimL family protein N-acetyltransferase